MRAAAPQASDELDESRVEQAYFQYMQARLARAALHQAPQVGTDELVAAADAGMLARARATTRHSARPRLVDEEGRRLATETAAAADDVRRWRWHRENLRPVKWGPLGAVIPVLAASPGTGASVIAAALTDAISEAGMRTLLVDGAEPTRSGLANAARVDGPWTRGPHPLVSVRFSLRSGALLGRVDSDLPVITPGMVPSPAWWRPNDVALAATVVDIGHDAWRVAANPMVGVGAWLRHGEPPPRPLLVCRASQPSLLHAEQVLARLEPWVGLGALAAVEQLVVVGARRWPAGVVGGAGRRLADLVENALFVPHDKFIAARGVTDRPIPQHVRRALRRIVSWIEPGNVDAAGVP